MEYREELRNRPLPQGLHPVVAEKRDQLIEEASGRGIDIIITDDFRSFEEQDEIYEQGRTTEGNIVSYARGGESYHNFGLAIDFAIRDGEDVLWDLEYDGNENGESDWMEVVAIAKDLGFDWGGDFRGFKDYPHFEMPFGLSIRELQRGERPEEGPVEY
ncbi:MULTISPECIES: M15 family metallopeptidase [Jeotgalibacillus]|uniref:M15 family metallopeptidase n=1 Tax=Jeotgalibacillus TaxID=157226 RepID=UPI00106B1ABF|nr:MULTISPECIES: M15 family metallopeptidase [Jeotgalibacillus]TFD98417.1 M15 family peptidase [Jeotgalibacillus sp. R-1-5s-1]